MATIVRDGRDPWWAPLAVNVLGGLFNDWQQRERNKKENAAAAEVIRQMTQNDTAPAPVPAQDTGQGLLNTDGWAGAFHKNENPFAQFDLGTAGLAPTIADNAPTALPTNTWANALGNSGNTLTQTNTAATALPAQGNRIPTTLDIYNVMWPLLGSKRFGMVNPDRMQSIFAPYLKANEEARQEQMRNALADDYTNATDGAGRIKTVTGGALRGIVPESMANTVFNQNKPIQSTVDAGGQIHFYNTDPMTGMPINTWAVDRTLTPQQQLDHQFRILQHEAQQAQLREQMNYNREGRAWEQGYKDKQLAFEQNQVTGTPFTGNDGYQYIMTRNGNTIKITDVPGLTPAQTKILETHENNLRRIATEKERLQIYKGQLINKGIPSDDPEIIGINKRLQEIETQEKGIKGDISNILQSVSTGQQGQSQTGQPTEQSLPPAGQKAPNNGNTVIPLPPAVLPIAQNITNAIKRLERQRDILSATDDEAVFRRKSDGKIFTGKMIREIMQRADNGEFRNKGVTSAEGVINWLVTKHGFEPITDIFDNTQNKAKNKITELGTPQEKNIATTKQQTPTYNSNLNQFDVIEANNTIGNNNNGIHVANAPANNSSIGDFFNIFGATPAYADENVPNNTNSATDTNTEAGIQRAIEELNGQFGEQRWADWASDLDMRGVINSLAKENMLEALPNSQSYPAPNAPIDTLFTPPVPQQFAPNSGTIPNAIPQAQNINPEGIVLASNRRSRRSRPQRTYLGHYSGDTTNGGQYSNIINRHAKTHNVDPDLIAAIIQQESGGNDRAVSPKGAGGLMQLMPKTARGLGVTDVFDPEQNIAGGTKYIAQMLRRYNGNVEKALWAYNAGPGNADKGRLPDETKKYIPSVIARYRRLKGIVADSPRTSAKTTRKRRRARNRRRR